MSKTTTGRFPSVKNNLSYQRKQSKEMTGSSKEDLGQTTYMEMDRKFETQPMSTMQNEIANKIKSKLRLRKPSASQKKLSNPHTLSKKNISNTSSSQSSLMATDIQEQIDTMWENSHQIFQLLQSSELKINQQMLKSQLIKQSSVLMCRLAKGEDLQKISIQKLKKMLDKAKCIKKCQQKQNSVKSMFDNRIQQLNMILKTR